LVQEFVPARLRGFIGGLVTACIPLGVMIASAIAAFLTPEIGWRGLFVVGLLPALFTLVIRAWVPESPHWLLSRGRREEARRSLAWALQVPVEQIPTPTATEAPSDAKWIHMFRYPRSLAVSWLASIGAQTASYGVGLWGPTLFVLQLGVTPAYAAYLFIWVKLAGIGGRVTFALLSDWVGRRPTGMLCGFIGAIFVAAAGTLHNEFMLDVSLFWLCIVVGDFFYDGGFALIGPYMAEVWPTSLRATGMGSAYGFGGIGKIIGPLGLAVIVGTSNVVTPQMTLNAIMPSFLYLAAWLVLCGGAFMLFGFETGRRSIAALDEGFTDATPGRTLSAHAGGQD
jgi:putative MFS transporter